MKETFLFKEEINDIKQHLAEQDHLHGQEVMHGGNQQAYFPFVNVTVGTSNLITAHLKQKPLIFIMTAYKLSKWRACWFKLHRITESKRLGFWLEEKQEEGKKKKAKRKKKFFTAEMQM